jgi:hypothetical protein
MILDFLIVIVMLFYSDNRGILFLFISYLYIMGIEKNVFNRISILIPWTVMLFYTNTNPYDIVLMILCVFVKEIINKIK